MQKGEKEWEVKFDQKTEGNKQQRIMNGKKMTENMSRNRKKR
jgi:hypothetical protein